MTSTVLVANAPCSYGAWEETIGTDPLVPDGLEVLEQVAAAGYSGIDLGPVGYLGEGPTLAERLRARDLGLAGGYLEMTFDDPRALDGQLADLNALLDVFDAAAGSKITPKPTLAGAGSPSSTLTRPEDRPQRGDEVWDRFADGVSAALEACRSRGYEPTFHHHVGSWIETTDEIERLLSLTDVSLCLDSGHLAVCGGDPVQAIRDWSERINHVHVKDADMAAVEALVASGAAVNQLFREEVFTPLGQGELNCEAFLRELRSAGYAGWIVVEQDIFAPRGDRAAQAQSDQERSLAFLRDHGF